MAFHFNPDNSPQVSYPAASSSLRYILRRKTDGLGTEESSARVYEFTKLQVKCAQM